jgi:hypothetical protein
VQFYFLTCIHQICEEVIYRSQATAICVSQKKDNCNLLNTSLLTPNMKNIRPTQLRKMDSQLASPEDHINSPYHQPTLTQLRSDTPDTTTRPNAAARRYSAVPISPPTPVLAGAPLPLLNLVSSQPCLGPLLAPVSSRPQYLSLSLPLPLIGWSLGVASEALPS